MDGGGAISDVRSRGRLLACATALERAAMHDDMDAVHTELCALRNALVEHLHREDRMVDQLPEATATVVRNGHERLLCEIDELLAHSTQDGQDCACMIRSVQLTRSIAQQARVEGRLLRRRPGLSGRTG